MNLEVGKHYVVTKDSSDMSFQVGDHIRLNADGSINCREACAWLDKEDVPSATLGMEFKIDMDWYQFRLMRLIKDLEELENAIK